jgi:hypothetical protein
MTGTPPANPKLNEPWIDDAGEELYWNGVAWVAYADPPELPGRDLDPVYLERED